MQNPKFKECFMKQILVALSALVLLTGCKMENTKVVPSNDTENAQQARDQAQQARDQAQQARDQTQRRSNY